MSALGSTGVTEVPGPALHVDAAPEDPTEPQAPTSPTLAEAEEIAKGFLDAYGDFDTDRAISYLADDSVVAMVGTMSGTQEEFRLELSLLEAIGYQHTINDCETQDDSTSDIHLRCSFDLHALRSDALGLGPYTDNYWDLTVRDGTITSALSTWSYASNGFGDQSWGPLSSWIAAQHPDDIPAMYTDDRQTDWRLTEQSIRLWEQRTKEYAATNKRTD